MQPPAAAASGARRPAGGTRPPAGGQLVSSPRLILHIESASLLPITHHPYMLLQALACLFCTFVTAANRRVVFDSISDVRWKHVASFWVHQVWSVGLLLDITLLVP